MLVVVVSTVGGFALAACDAEEAPETAVAVADGADVPIVRNLAPPLATIELRAPGVRIGSPAIDLAEEHAFEWVSDIAVLPDGRIVIVDNLGARVALFSARGEWRGDLGRAGSGPGEHRNPRRAWTRGDTVIVWDWVQRRLTRFSPDGDVLGTRRFAEDKPQGFPVEPFGNGWLDDRESGQRMDPAPARAALVRLDADGAVRDTLLGPYPVPEVGWRTVDEATGMGQMVSPPVFSVRPSWAVLGDAVAWTSGTEPRIEIRGEHGALRRVIELPRPARQVTAADRDAYFRAVQQRFGVPDAAIEQGRRETEFMATLPAITALIADDRGRLWAAEHDPASAGDGIGRAWDVLAPDGRITMHVRFPAGFRLLRVQDGRAYGVTTTEDGVHVVDVFELAEEIT